MPAHMVFWFYPQDCFTQGLTTDVLVSVPVALSCRWSVSHEHVDVIGYFVPHRVHFVPRQHKRPRKKLWCPRASPDFYPLDRHVLIFEILPVRDRETRTGAFVLVVETPVMVPGTNDFVTIRVVGEPVVEFLDFLEATVNRDVAGNDEDVAIGPVPVVPMPMEIASAHEFHVDTIAG